MGSDWRTLFATSTKVELWAGDLRVWGRQDTCETLWNRVALTRARWWFWKMPPFFWCFNTDGSTWMIPEINELPCIDDFDNLSVVKICQNYIPIYANIQHKRDLVRNAFLLMSIWGSNVKYIGDYHNLWAGKIIVDPVFDGMTFRVLNTVKLGFNCDVYLIHNRQLGKYNKVNSMVSQPVDLHA